jgi:hypothetical protein
MYVLTEPAYPRRKVEKTFKQVYNFGMVLNFGAFMITVTQFSSRLSSTFVNFFGSDYKLTSGLAAMLQNCPAKNSTFTMNGLSADAALDNSSAPFAFITTTNVILGVLVVHAVVILLDFIAKTCFSMNIRHLRIGAAHIPLTTSLVGGVWGASIAVIAMIASSHSTLSFVNNFVDKCAVNYQNKNNAEFVSTENDRELVFGTNLIFILVATCINLFLYVCGSVAYLYNASKPGESVLLKEKYPWEKGFLCAPDKPKLKAWTKWREQQLEAVVANTERDKPGYLDMIARSDELEKQEKARILEEQSYANDIAHFKRSAQRPPTSPGGSRSVPISHSQHHDRAGYGHSGQHQNHGAPRGGKEVPAPYYDEGQMLDDENVGDGLMLDDGDYPGDGVAADYVDEPTRRRHRRRRHAGEEGRDERRRHRRRHGSDRQYAEGAEDEEVDGDHYAAVPMDRIDGPA